MSLEEIIEEVDKIPEKSRNPSESRDNVIEEILNTVASSSAIFKSQQKDDPELSFDEKKKIANDLLKKNDNQFLSKFGKFLNANLLNYFTEKSEDYEINYHVNKLRRYFDNKTRKIDRKNRRYEALKQLIEKGEYFSETEMMKRNPLLYDNLIGKYLSEEEKKTRDNLDTKNITFVNLLMEGIERDCIKKLKKSQEDAEDEVFEENDSDEEECDDENDDDDDDEREFEKWGEFKGGGEDKGQREVKKKVNLGICEINCKEQQVLRQEFVTAMYQSFLDGKDTDFDYSSVDDNEMFDNVDLREQDEEEKYFDSESPELTSPDKKEEIEESEDELDKYMKTLKEQASERTT